MDGTQKQLPSADEAGHPKREPSADAAGHPKREPKGSRAVMNRRLEPLDALDFFPTPPWATRALLHHVLLDAHGSCWEPAAGEGHMAEVLRERFETVHASDVHDYGRGYAVGSFAGRTEVPEPPAQCPFTSDWIMTNPAFNGAIDVALRALDEARRGVALLVRSNWTEGVDRYRSLFRPRPPQMIAQFAERVPMTKDCWDPDASTATAYAWFIWDRARSGTTRTIWIPPGCRQSLTKVDDRKRFAAWSLEEPASPEQDLITREMRDACLTPAEMMDALAISKDRLTRFLRDIAKADAKKKRGLAA